MDEFGLRPPAPAPPPSGGGPRPASLAAARRAAALRLAGGTVRGGALGAMLLLGLLGALTLWEGTAYESFINWAGIQGHALLRRPARIKLRNRYGDDYESFAAYERSKHVLGSLIAIGLAGGAVVGLIAAAAPLAVRRLGRFGVPGTALLGLLTGALFGGWLGLSLHDRHGTYYALESEPETTATGEEFSPAEKKLKRKQHHAAVVRGVRRKWLLCVLGCAGAAAAAGALFGLRQKLSPPPAPGPAREPESALPWAVPLGLAVLGLIHYGFIWGNAAVWALPHARRKRWAAAATWCVAALAVLAWGWGLETNWGEGWSKSIPPWLHDLIYTVGHLVGLKE